MSQNDTTRATPQTLSAATIDTDASLDGLLLLGIMETAKGAHALIRKPNGRVTRVEPGDKVGRRTVAAIDQGQLIFSRGKTTERLTIPG